MVDALNTLKPGNAIYASLLNKLGRRITHVNR